MRRTSSGVVLGAAIVAFCLLTPGASAVANLHHWSELAQQPELVLVDAASLSGWLFSGWLLFVTFLTLVSRLPTAGGRAAARLLRWLTPAVARRVLEAVLGVGLALGPAGAALAGTAPAALAPVPAPVVAPVETLFPSLDRPLAPAAPTPAPTAIPAAPAPSPTSPPPEPTARHVVVRGDTLWGLASAALPDGASAPQITERWRQWYAANRATIGTDPDLLLPGMVLDLAADAR